MNPNTQQPILKILIGLTQFRIPSPLRERVRVRVKISNCVTPILNQTKVRK